MKQNSSFVGIDIRPSERNKKTSSENPDVDKQGLKEQKRDRYKQNTRFRRHLAVWVMWIVPAWLVLVITLVYLCASDLFYLSDSSMVALLATTTVNVLGLAFIVLKGLFNVRT